MKLYKILIASLIVAIAIFALSFRSRDSLKKRLLAIYYQPAISNDYDQLKIIYNDLFEHNSRSYNLAGKSAFPINTDALRPVADHQIHNLSQILRYEILLKLSYTRRIPEKETQRQAISVRTNQWRPLLTEKLTEKKRIAKLTIKPLTTQNIKITNISIQEEIPLKIDEASLSRKVSRLFHHFLSLRKNGVSPLGKDFRISFDEFTSVYGYGQCYNQSYALADLLDSHGIALRLVHIDQPPHVLLEARIDNNRWAALDPLLEIAFLDPKNGSCLSFDQIRADLETALIRFPPKDQETANSARSYYRGSNVTMRRFVPPPHAEGQYAFSLSEDQYVEYSFGLEAYPWLTERNLKTPPAEVIGYFKHSWGTQRNFNVTTPYPMVEAEVALPETPSLLSVDGQEVFYDPSWEFVRLNRYLTARRTLQLSSSLPVRLTTVSRFSTLPFYQMTDGLIRVSADRDVLVEVVVDYFLD